MKGELDGQCREQTKQHKMEDLNSPDGSRPLQTHRVPKAREPENNPQGEHGERCSRGAEALISSQAPPASLRNLG